MDRSLKEVIVASCPQVNCLNCRLDSPAHLPLCQNCGKDPNKRPHPKLPQPKQIPLFQRGYG